MATQNLMPQHRFEPEPEVFDQAHLARYTMNSADLEREIIGLFLVQLPDTVAMIEAAETAADWRLATHTLKGSAMAVGARRLIAVAAELEKAVVGFDAAVKSTLMRMLHGAVAEFQDTVRRAYP